MHGKHMGNYCIINHKFRGNVDLFCRCCCARYLPCLRDASSLPSIDGFAFVKLSWASFGSSSPRLSCMPAMLWVPSSLLLFADLALWLELELWGSALKVYCYPNGLVGDVDILSS